MTGPRAMPRTSRGWLLAGAVALAVSVVACGGPASYEIPIETPIQPKLDVTPFQRVLIAGFVAGGSEDVDTNQETVRLLRSQLRSKSGLRIIDADVMPLQDVAQEQSRGADAPAPAPAADRDRNDRTAAALPARPPDLKYLKNSDELGSSTSTSFLPLKPFLYTSILR